MNVAGTPLGELVFANPSTKSSLSREAKAGRAVRLAPAVYAIGATLPVEACARHHILAITAHFFPGAVLAGRTALAGGLPVGGRIYLSHPDPPRRAALTVPGIEVIVGIGPAPLPGDMPMPFGLHLSGRVRKLIENINVAGRPAASRAGTKAVEDEIDTIARDGGPGAVAGALAELDVIANFFDPRPVEAVRARLAAVLGTKTPGIASPGLRARVEGNPFDGARIELLDGLVRFLLTRPPSPRPAGGESSRWEWLPFFEAYFSNFIEGTEFGVDEARRIAVEGEVPVDRPADAHDVAATFRLASDPVERSGRPVSADWLIAVLQARHRTLMAARPDKHPGVFKKDPNYAGGYQFVHPDLVEGTLRHGFDLMAQLIDPFARAVAMMALITECHPFDDGNGRLARLMANAELTAAGDVRIIIPTVYRNNYLVALSGFSNRSGTGQGLTSVLEFAQRWVSNIDWSTYEGAKEQLEAANAFVDPAIGDASGQKLKLV